MAKKGADLAQSVSAGPTHSDPVDNYEVQGHLETLQKAHGIMNDPDKMAKVHKLAGRHAKALAGIKALKSNPPMAPKVKSVDDLKALSNKMNSAPASDGDDA